MQIVKRNGLLEDYNQSKIVKAITQAFNAQHEAYTDEIIEDILNELVIHDQTSVEDIQDQVEQALFETGHFKVCKAYMNYRSEHKELRLIKDRSDYIDKCIYSRDNTATLSEVDSNANVQNRNVATIEAEVMKPIYKKLQRYKMKKRLKQMFPEVADNYEEDLESHILYMHDEASCATIKPYCVAASLYPFFLHGTSQVDHIKSKAPTNLISFCGQFNNLIFLLSSQFKGAVACLHKDQPLLINNKQVKVKDFVTDHWNNPEYNDDWEYCRLSGEDTVLEDGKEVSIKKVFRKKYSDKIYKIKSNKGFIATTSKDHKFKVLRAGEIEEVTAENLRVFDTVFVNNNIPIDFSSNDFQRGWIKGMLLGDGCLTQLPSISLSVNYEQEFYGNIFNDYSKQQYGNTLSLCSGHKCFNYERQNEEYAKRLTEDLVGNTTYDKHLEKSPSNYSVNFLVGILDGLLSADGCDNHSIILSLANEALINDIKGILDILRVNYTYKVIPEKDNNHALYYLTISSQVIKYTPHFNKKLRGNKNCNETYYFSGKARKNGRKDPNYILPTTRDHFVHSEYKLDVITSINTFDNDDEYVYEIETESHWYNCGGFITHNCGEFFNAVYYYCTKEWGPDFYLRGDEVANCASIKAKTIEKCIEQAFQNIVFSVNQPAGNRSFQSPSNKIRKLL